MGIMLPLEVVGTVVGALVAAISALVSALVYQKRENSKAVSSLIKEKEAQIQRYIEENNRIRLERDALSEKLDTFYQEGMRKAYEKRQNGSPGQC